MNDVQQYYFRGDKKTAPEYRGAVCIAVKQLNGKSIRGRNGNFLVQFSSGRRVVVPGRLLRKIMIP